MVRLGDIPPLDQLYMKLKNEFDCTYLTYMIEEGNKKTYFSSNEKWQSVFIENNLINHCPIYRNAFLAVNTKKMIFTAWDNVAHKKGVEQDVMDLRMSFNIAHGLGLAIQGETTRESLVFASHTGNHFFHDKIANSSTICTAIKVFRSHVKNNLLTE